jgi:hypothetical protein
MGPARAGVQFCKVAGAGTSIVRFLRRTGPVLLAVIVKVTSVPVG